MTPKRLIFTIGLLLLLLLLLLEGFNRGLNGLKTSVEGTRINTEGFGVKLGARDVDCQLMRLTHSMRR